jgi:hypothetical protein
LAADETGFPPNTFPASRRNSAEQLLETAFFPEPVDQTPLAPHGILPPGPPTSSRLAANGARRELQMMKMHPVRRQGVASQIQQVAVVGEEQHLGAAA